MRALKKLRANKAYYISVGPDISEDTYEKISKNESQKYRLHEVPVGLSLRSASLKTDIIKQWKERRNLLGKNMRLGKAQLKEAWLN